MPYGIITHAGGSRAQVISRLALGLQEAGCEITHQGASALSVRLPGLDSILPLEAGREIQQLFWDKMIVTVDENGIARYQMVYWNSSQVFIHLLIAVGFAFDVWFFASPVSGAFQFLARVACFHLLLAAVFIGSFHFSQRAVFRKALA